MHNLKTTLIYMKAQNVKLDIVTGSSGDVLSIIYRRERPHQPLHQSVVVTNTEYFDAVDYGTVSNGMQGEVVHPSTAADVDYCARDQGKATVDGIPGHSDQVSQ